MKILVTGAGGFLGRGMVIPLAAAGHELRLMDVSPFESEHDVRVGDVSDLDSVLELTEGMDGIIIAHMLGRGPGAYESPEGVMDVNVKGTANLLHAAVERGIRNVVLISSESVISAHKGTPLANRRLSPRKTANEWYGLSKILQEVLCEHFAEVHGQQMDVLRVGYILDGERCEDKYGRKVGERAPPDTDRRDIGEVARLCLERDHQGMEIFHVMSTPESMDEHEVRYTCERLGWQPKYDFTWLPLPGEK